MPGLQIFKSIKYIYYNDIYYIIMQSSLPLWSFEYSGAITL
jgi:hypothetical protein